MSGTAPGTEEPDSRVYTNEEGGEVRISPGESRRCIGEKEMKMRRKQKKEKEERLKERWGISVCGGGRSIFSNLAQEEAIFSVLDGQINTAFQTFISAWRHKRLLRSSPGRKKKKTKEIVFSLVATLSPLVS